MKIILHNPEAHGICVSYFDSEEPTKLHSLFVPGNGNSEPVERSNLTDHANGLIATGTLSIVPVPEAE
jgi:hypothetical protein